MKDLPSIFRRCHTSVGTGVQFQGYQNAVYCSGMTLQQSAVVNQVFPLLGFIFITKTFEREKVCNSITLPIIFSLKVLQILP